MFTFQLTEFQGIIFYAFVANSVRIFFWQLVHTDKPNFASFLVFVGTAASFTAKISSFKAFPKQWISKVIQSYGANQKSTDLVNTNIK